MGALGRLARALLLALSARPRPLSKKSMSFARLFRVLSREPGRSGSIFGRPDAPGLDFGGRNASIFERFRRACAFAAYFARSQQNAVKTNTNSTSELSRDKTKTMKNRSDDASDCACRVARTPTSLRTSQGTSWDRPGLAFGRLPTALGTLGASQDRSWAGFGASRARPERVPTRPRNSLGRPKPPKSEFSSIFRRFWLGFSTIFDRSLLDLRGEAGVSIFSNSCLNASGVGCSCLFFSSLIFQTLLACFARACRNSLQNANAKVNARLSRASNDGLHALARTTYTTRPTTYEPTLYTFDQADHT